MHTGELLERLEHLEQSLDALRMQNRVLAAALKGLLHGLPADTAEDAAEAVRLALEDELSELEYGNSPHTELFHEAAEALFRAKR